jgi:hypothetical protein
MPRRLVNVSVNQGFGHNLLTPAEFTQIPMGERIQLLMKNKVVFLDEEGQTMPVLDAIDQLPQG